MGCGCKQRGQVLASARAHLVSGRKGQAAARIGVAVSSAARDAKAAALSAARRAFLRR